METAVPGKPPSFRRASRCKSGGDGAVRKLEKGLPIALTTVRRQRDTVHETCVWPYIGWVIDPFSSQQEPEER